ncbi:MAG: hypothetical protein IMY72_05495 [Bacteroidetes bacterium]|nr:hypothetical protein [Bacteroidota bacterium]
MRTTIMLIFLCISTLSFSQVKEFIVEDLYVINSKVNACEGKMASDLYSKTNDWINYTYLNPDNVIKGKVENDFIRFKGSKKDFYIDEIMGQVLVSFDLIYVFKIDFKDDKYRLALESYDIIEVTGNHKLTLASLVKDGEIDDTLPYYYSFKRNLLKEINELNTSLYDYISGKKETQEDDW